MKSSRARRTLLLLSFLIGSAAGVTACARSDGPSPTLRAVEPSRMGFAEATRVQVQGSGFAARVKADFADPVHSEVDAHFALTLVKGAFTAPLAKVVLVDEATLSAEVPALLEPGVYQLQLVDPRGRAASLNEAITIESGCSQQPYCSIAGRCFGQGERNPFQPCQLCDPARTSTGWSAADEASACDDHNACSSQDHCEGGKCVGASQCGNTAPRACFSLASRSGTTATSFNFDASCSSDLEDATDTLQFRFDFDGDGTFDTGYGGPTASVVYPAVGQYEVTVEVRDPAGLLGRTRHWVRVYAGAAEVRVTTAVDEADVGATPDSPGGTGLSLREAITYVNALPSSRTVRIDSNLQLKLAALPALTAPGTWVVGEPGALLDFGASGAGGAPCLELAGAGQALLGLSLRHCGSVMILVRGGSSQVIECVLEQGPAAGIRVTGAGAKIGPGNAVSRFDGPGVELRQSGGTVDGNQLHHNALGILLSNQADSSTLSRNEVFRNLGDGISLGKNTPGAQVLQNTVVGNGANGITLFKNAAAVTVRNNLLVGHRGAGVGGAANGLGASAPNLFFANDGGNLPAGAPEAGNLFAAPLFIGEEAEDFRLAPNSPAINAGVDLGLDLNGPGPGNHDGVAPDLGARESPY